MRPDLPHYSRTVSDGQRLVGACEGDEKMVVVLERADGAVRDDYLAVGTIEDSDD